MYLDSIKHTKQEQLVIQLGRRIQGRMLAEMTNNMTNTIERERDGQTLDDGMVCMCVSGIVTYTL
jgi:hypothetical protein